MRQVVIAAATRTPFGAFGGSLKDFTSTSLTVLVMEELIRRAGIPKEEVDEVVWGSAITCEFGDWPRSAALKAGLPVETPAILVNHNCASGMQAIRLGYQAIALGEADTVLAGGTEIMSRAPYWLTTARWGQRLKHGEMTDSLWGSLTDPTTGLLLGEATERLAAHYGIGRQPQDELALSSHLRAVRASKSNRLAQEITPVPTKPVSAQVIDADEGPREDASLEKLMRLRPAFQEDGTVTAGNSSSLNDGAAGLVLMAADRVSALGVRPLAYLRACSVVGVDPLFFGYGPVPASRAVLKKTELTIGDIDLWEINEAFAAQYLVCERELKLDRDKVNVNGGAIALGHPVAASGPRLVTTLICELALGHREWGVAAMCVGGGMGAAVVLQLC